MNLKILIPVAVLLLAAGGCTKHGTEPAPASAESVEVTTTEAQLKSHQRSHWLPGTVHPSDEAIMAAKLMANVAKVNSAIGQSVKQGDILIELQADEVDARVEQAKAALAQVERNLVRERALFQQSATTAETVRTLEDQVRLAKAQLAEATTMESYKFIRAPFDGTITSKQVRRGDLATPGTPLLTIEGNGPREIHVQVPDSLSTLPHGDSVMIQADGESIEARLAEWSPAADPSSRSRLAKLSLPDSTNVRSGQYVRVDWPAATTQSVWLPNSAISRSGQMERVYTIQGSVARMRLVRTGGQLDGWTQILSGIDPGEEVILEPGARLRDRQPIVLKK